MRITQKLTFFLLLVMIAAGCNYVTYTPRNRKKQQREKPSIVLLDRIIAYREEFNSWPFSKEEFISKGQKYREAFDGFPYARTEFKVKNNNTMTFAFYEHISDRKRYRETGQLDLNGYWGEVRFFKEKDKFIWKIKMK